MASTKGYLEHFLSLFSPLDEISYRAMMGEFLLYYRGRLFGGIYDDRLLVKDIPAAATILVDAQRVVPYPGAKAMLMVTEPFEREDILTLVKAMYEALPEPKKRGKGT